MAGAAHDLAVAFRVCQIWFQQSQCERVNAALADMAAQVPSHKFLCLVYQIASRLSAPEPPAQPSRFQVRGLQTFACRHSKLTKLTAVSGCSW